MTRVCAFVGCANGTYRQERWKQQRCPKHHCMQGRGSCDCKLPFELFPFPTEKRDPEARRRWVNLVQRMDPKTKKEWEAKKHSCVCSIHFKDNKPTTENPDPCLNVDHEQIVFSKTKKQPQRTAVCKNRISGVEHRDEGATGPHVDHNYVMSSTCETGCDCECADKLDELTNALQDAQQKLTQVKHKKRPKKKHDLIQQDASCFLSSDKKVKTFTGLTSRKAFDDLLTYVSPKALKMSHWRYHGTKKVVSTKKKSRSTPRKLSPRRKLSLRKELLLVLMKLKLGCETALLAEIFGVSEGKATIIFTAWIKLLASELKPFIFFPSRDLVKSSFPNPLKPTYNNLVCTVDCTEVLIEQPRNPRMRSLTWSEYKNHNTVKFLVATAPNGHISFLSQAWGGRASDIHIIWESDFYTHLDSGDLVFSSKDFTSIKEDLMEFGAHLETPIRISGQPKQSKEDVLKIRSIASACNHVERAVARIKGFSILNNILPFNLVPLIDEIVIVCAALCNLSPSLVH